MKTSVRRHTPSIAVLTLVLAGSVVAMARDHPAHSAQVDQSVTYVPPVQLIIGGVVRRVLGSGVFILDDPHSTDRELMVLVPDAEATPMAGASVVARGLFRTFDEAALEQILVWNELDEHTREAFGRRPILLATSLTTASGRSLVARTSSTVRPLIRRLPVGTSRSAAEIRLHPASLAELIDEVGGRPVVLPRARVLAVVNPRVLLIESASSLLATRGNLDRVLVLIQDGALRVDAAALTDEKVRIVGVARTLLGIKITGEVAWPAALTQDMVERLEIRAAVLATSVHTADGVELTDRQTQPQK